MYPKFLAVIRLLVKKALVLAVLTSGIQTVLEYARQQPPMVSDKPEAISITEEPAQTEIEGEVESPQDCYPTPTTEPFGHSRGAASATTGRLHSISTRPT